MSVGRALVDCAVLSLQDSCVFYPCCKGCYSKLDVEQQDKTRFRCSKCGYRCLREQVDYRYRLSLRVTRDRSIFGVTVFGNSLNPFFGINASGLQRLVENLDGDGASTRLLVKAVEDCFIGRHFIFGIKILETENRPWMGGSALNGSNIPVQLVASQMILPEVSGLGGCTVLSYYRTLLQKVSENELRSANHNKTSNHPTLLLIQDQSPNRSFHDATLSSPGLHCDSLQRLQHQYSILTPTPPWQQSLGVITSSAEQEEGGSTVNKGDDSSRLIDNRTPAQDCLKNHDVTEERTPIVSLESFYNDLSFTNYPTSSVKKPFGNIPSQNAWFSPFRSGHKSSNLNMKEFSASQIARTFLSNSLVWDDLPFSESLTEFLCGENKNLDVNCETETTPNAYYQKDKTKDNVENRNLITNEPASERNRQPTASDPHMLLDVSNKVAPNGSDKHSGTKDICYCESNQKEEEGCSLSFEKEREIEKLEEDTYNCSADLFSGSEVSMNTEATQEEQHPRNENTDVTLSTPNRLRRSECNNRESFIPQGTFDFVPPSQSTPISKVGVMSGGLSSKPNCQDSRGNLFVLDSEKPSKVTSCLHKFNTVGSDQFIHCGKKSSKKNPVRHRLCSRLSYRLKSENRSWTPDRCKVQTQTQQHQMICQRGTPTLQSAGSLRLSEMIVHDNKNNEVPPTPVNKMQLSVRLRRKELTENSRSTDMSLTCHVQRVDGVKCKRTLLHHSCIQTGNGDSETAVESLNKSNDYSHDDENQTCDYSRDLFSDSV